MENEARDDKDPARFGTPEGYFDHFLDNLKDRIAKEESSIPTSDGFSAPEGYLENLDAGPLYSRAREGGRVLSFRSTPFRETHFKTVAGIAAAAIVLLGVFIGRKGGDADSWEGLATADIEAYLATEGGLLYSEELADYVAWQQIDLNDIWEDDIAVETLYESLDLTLEDVEALNLDYETLE